MSCNPPIPPSKPHSHHNSKPNLHNTLTSITPCTLHAHTMWAVFQVAPAHANIAKVIARAQCTSLLLGWPSHIIANPSQCCRKCHVHAHTCELTGPNNSVNKCNYIHAMHTCVARVQSLWGTGGAFPWCVGHLTTFYALTQHHVQTTRTSTYLHAHCMHPHPTCCSMLP